MKFVKLKRQKLKCLFRFTNRGMLTSKSFIFCEFRTKIEDVSPMLQKYTLRRTPCILYQRKWWFTNFNSILALSKNCDSWRLFSFQHCTSGLSSQDEGVCNDKWCYFCAKTKVITAKILVNSLFLTTFLLQKNS